MPLVCHKIMIAIQFPSLLQPRLVKSTRSTVTKASAGVKLDSYLLIQADMLFITTTEQ